MFVCLLETDLHIPGARSLKEKRRVLKSVKERLKKRYNAAVVEIGDKDKWQSAGLGICFLAENKNGAEKLARQALAFILDDFRLVVARHRITVY